MAAFDPPFAPTATATPTATTAPTSGPNASASVFWDHENCAIPKDTRGFVVVRRIKDLLLSRNLTLTNIIAVGDASKMNAQTKLELEESGVVLQNISSGKPSAADIAILNEIMKNIYFHKPPHSIFLISGDRDFSKTLNFLESVNYSVTLIHSNRVSDVLRYSVRDTILWSSLIRGGDASKPCDRSRNGGSSSSSSGSGIGVLSESGGDAGVEKARPARAKPPATIHTRVAPPQSSSSSSSSIVFNRHNQAGFLRSPSGSAVGIMMPYPKSPERALLILREIKAIGMQIARSPKTDVSEANIGRGICLKTELSRFKGRNSKKILARASIMEATNRNFYLLVSCILDLDEKGIKIRKRDLFKSLHSNQSIIKTYGYKSTADYFAAAVVSNVISENKSDETVSLCLAVSTQSTPPQENDAYCATQVKIVVTESPRLSQSPPPLVSSIPRMLSGASSTTSEKPMSADCESDAAESRVCLGMFETETLAVKSVADGSTDDSRNTVKSDTEFVWRFAGSHVGLIGSWDGWQHETPMEEVSSPLDEDSTVPTKTFRTVLGLATGQIYEYVFVVDGMWTVDPEKPVVHRNAFVNNIIQIQCVKQQD
ncbi:hypothetical protein HDU83_000893 [Entophlyctis luteolus]|nr:hypothetical protein HDU83_000893 [Entophlyctis luteolus]